uniref:Pogo transposable element derived with ZNF domain a n=1 Tax=Gasterosteus aculeatus aculeatus TaxID=481459 RepID=A0AAQ4PCN2_GASAC
METQSAAADLLMFCDEEEEEEAWPREPNEEEEEEEEVVYEEALDVPPVTIIPLPVQPVGCPLPLSHMLESPGVPLGFKVNGVLVRLMPGGGAAELKLRAHPGGSASGFTSVHMHNAALGTACTGADPTPIITGVLSGEAAHMASTVGSEDPLWTRTTPPPSPQTTRLPPPTSGSSRPVASSDKLQLKGPVSPPNCLVCSSQYKLITELRGFMCLCSRAIANSLKNLKKKKKKRFRGSRDRKKTSKTSRHSETSSKVSKTRPGPPVCNVSPLLQRTRRTSGDFPSDRFPGPPPHSTTCSPGQGQSAPAPDPPHGKLVIMVEDFYYGRDPGHCSKPPSLDRRFTGPHRCIHCPQKLRNNLRLMSHMKQHVSSMSQDYADVLDSQCPHCFRHFLSPFKLQCHVEAVHSQYQSTAKCKICELEFVSEAAFLWHMKRTHKPGEMPYVCQVCGFRSSFYSDVWSHFKQIHSDSRHLLCQYCLRVMRSNTCYQQHFARHQKKHVFSCDKCRLHFLYVRERIEHQVHHRTHIRPSQLIGLKPGTKVTVRTYSVVGGQEDEDLQRAVAPCEAVNVSRPQSPSKQEAPKMRPVRSLGPLLSAISRESVSRPPQRCVECLSWVQDFGIHFPSLVHCSLCRFITCCSASYANHMINNHASCRKNPPYLTIFLSEPRLTQSLRCVSCTFTTWRGDVMANHLTEFPEHHCVTRTHQELNVNGREAQNQEPPDSVTLSAGQGGGAFIPIHLLPFGQTSSLLSVRHHTSPSPLSSPPAMTIKFLGPRPQANQGSLAPLSASQLSVVLSSLCHGLPQASLRSHTSPLEVCSWIQQQERRLSDRKWGWRSEGLAQWVLVQREQQLNLSEGVLLRAARSALGEDSPLAECYSWTVDFLLRHGLGLQTANKRQRGRLPRSIRDNSRTFTRSLLTQIQGRGVPPHCVGSMDEFSIFVDLDQFSNQNPSALRLSGSPTDRPAFDVVLSALSDGTFLPPLLFFRGGASRVPEGFPDNVLLEARREGFTDQERLRTWINKVWRPRVVLGCNRETVLLVDVHRGHLTDEFRDSLKSQATGAAFIPPGCCCRLQPLDVCLTPVLRDFLQARWTQLVSEGGLEGLSLDQLALTLACWLSEVSFTLNSETHVLRRSFALVCSLQEDRGEAATMIAALTEALAPPETPERRPAPQLELLLVMKEEVEQQPDQMEVPGEEMEVSEKVEQHPGEDLLLTF